MGEIKNAYSPEPRKPYLTLSLIAIFFMCITMMSSCTTANATQPYNVDVQDYQKNSYQKNTL